MRVRKRVLVRGHVQNVWFRDSTRREADRNGLSGWVRNRADGTVEIEVEGPTNAVEALVAWAHTGPPRAEVSELSVDSLPVMGTSGFAIRPSPRL